MPQPAAPDDWTAYDQFWAAVEDLPQAVEPVGTTSTDSSANAAIDR